MNQKKKEKNFWKSYFGLSSPSLAPEKIHRLAWKDQEITDEDLVLLCARVKFIYQMDLDNNLISNQGIEYLTRLNEIEELRLKGLNIDDDSIPFIQKIKGLKVLHIGGTNISSEGVGRLSCITTLKELICTPDPVDILTMKRFKASLPDCELIVNYKEFEDND